MSRMGTIYLLSIKRTRDDDVCIGGPPIQLTNSRFKTQYGYYLDHNQYFQTRNNKPYGWLCRDYTTNIICKNHSCVINNKTNLVISVNNISYNLSKTHEFFASTGHELLQLTLDIFDGGWVLRYNGNPETVEIETTDIDNQWVTIQELAKYAKSVNPRI